MCKQTNRIYDGGITLRILGIERDKTACNFYRILSPLAKLDERELADVILVQESDLGNDKSVNSALWADIIVFQRPSTEAWFNFIKTCRKNGKLIVSDYDDDPFNTSPFNPYYQFIGTEEYGIQWEDGTKEMLWSEGMVSQNGNKIFDIEKNINHRDMFYLNFKKSDMVTCTTDILRNEFLKMNENVLVLPNLIDFNFFPPLQEFKKNEIRIGWQGGASHYEDLYLIKDVIFEILKNNPTAKFVYFGDMRFKGLFSKCNQKQIEWHPWVQHNAYPYKLAMLNLDIALCPLVDNVFNRNKSAIKWMEYSAMKFATIASDIPPYSEVIKQGETGLLVNSDKAMWIDSIQTLISSEHMRRNLSENSYEDVKLNHNIENKSHLWYDAYNKLINQEVTV